MSLNGQKKKTGEILFVSQNAMTRVFPLYTNQTKPQFEILYFNSVPPECC